MLSRIAQEFAAEIRAHDWSDAPFRADRAGHRREDDGRKRSEEQLDEADTGRVVANVMWVSAQVLMYSDPNLDLEEYAIACGVPDGFIHNSNGKLSGYLHGGIRKGWNGEVDKPGGAEEQ